MFPFIDDFVRSLRGCIDKTNTLTKEFSYIGKIQI